MPRRPIPGQASLLDVLDASLAGPVVRPGADPEWAARFLALLADGLPQGAPSPVNEVIAVWPGKPWDGRVCNLVAEVVMFDGVQHELHVRWWQHRRDYSLDLAFGAQPARERPYDWYYPAIRWDGCRWVRGEHSTDPNVSEWDADLVDGTRVLRGRLVAA